MRERFLLVAIGIAIGVLTAGGALFARREYRTRDEAQLAAAGSNAFARSSDETNGVGPGFNAASCATCHHNPEIGGAGDIVTLRVARRQPDGRHQAYPGGAIVHRFAARGCQPVVPADANVFSQRVPTTTFGAGLVEDIPDAMLIALEDPDDRDRNGVRGRAARVHDRASGAARIGRFGWKSQHASLVAFAAEAYAGEMGITNELYADDHVIGVAAADLRKCVGFSEALDDARNPSGTRSIDMLAAFMRSLPPPEPDGLAQTDEGERVFAAAGCALCHRPQVGRARAYSDFLLHDIGTGDGIAEGDAAGPEMRTALLWGIRHRKGYLHDGSAATIEAAVARHAGEAGSARQRFVDMPIHQQQQLVAFVKSR